MKPLITHERLTELLDYDAHTGVFRWRVWRGRMAPAGSLAGHIRPKDGYVQIKIEDRLYLAHVLAVFWTDREWPKEDTDHINGQRADNRRTNLRAATRAQNMANQKLRVTNRHGTKGVTWIARLRKWRAQITVKGQHKHIGLFETIHQASSAYEAKAAELFGEFKRAA